MNELGGGGRGRVRVGDDCQGRGRVYVCGQGECV